MDILYMFLALRSMILLVADAFSVVTPTMTTAIILASSDTAVLATISRFTPASTLEANTLARAVIQANWDLAIDSDKEGVAYAGSIVTVTIGTTVHVALLVGAIDTGP
jgi:hypothetical protein